MIGNILIEIWLYGGCTESLIKPVTIKELEMGHDHGHDQIRD